LISASFPVPSQVFTQTTPANYSNYFIDSLLLYSAANIVSSMTIQCPFCGNHKPLLLATFYNQPALQNVTNSSILMNGSYLF
jgi:hypothetical protein